MDFTQYPSQFAMEYKVLLAVNVTFYVNKLAYMESFGMMG